MGFMDIILNNTKRDPEFWYKRGCELCTSGYYLDALEALDKMLAKSTEHADSWFLKGYALYQMGKFEESLQFLDRALIYNPGLQDALMYKGLIYSGFGRHSDALTHYDRALAINPRHGKSWYVKGLTLAILGRYDEAIKAYERVLAIEPKHVDALTGISIAMKRRERSRETKPVRKTVDLFSAPTLKDPVPDSSQDTSAMPGRVFIPQPAKSTPLRDILSEARTTLQKKTGHDRSKMDIAVDTIQLISSGYPMSHPGKEAPVPANQYEIPLHGTADIITSAPPATRRNSYDEYINKTLKVLISIPDDSESLKTLGDLYIKVGKYQLATEAYERVLEREPENARTWAALGDAQRKLGRYDEAQFAYDRALEISDDDVSTWINRAKALAMQGRYDEAVNSCNFAIERENDNIDAWLYKGFILKKILRHSDALQAYDYVLTINPHHDHAIRQRKTLINGQ